MISITQQPVTSSLAYDAHKCDHHCGEETRVTHHWIHSVSSSWVPTSHGCNLRSRMFPVSTWSGASTGRRGWCQAARSLLRILLAVRHIPNNRVMFIIRRETEIKLLLTICSGWQYSVGMAQCSPSAIMPPLVQSSRFPVATKHFADTSFHHTHYHCNLALRTDDLAICCSTCCDNSVTICQMIGQ